MKKSTNNNQVKHDKNPFLSKVRTREGERKLASSEKDFVITDRTTDQEIATGGIWIGVTIDRTPFIKLFADGIRSLSKLSKPAFPVLEVVFQKMQENKDSDRVYLSYAALDKSRFDITEDRFSKGLNNLIKNEFIARSSMPSMFYINLGKIWNGDRLGILKKGR